MHKEIDKVLSIVGCQSSLAKALGVSDNAVSKWVAQGFIPPGRVLAAYQLVKGKPTPSGELVELELLLLESETKNTKAP